MVNSLHPGLWHKLVSSLSMPVISLAWCVERNMAGISVGDCMVCVLEVLIHGCVGNVAYSVWF